MKKQTQIPGLKSFPESQDLPGTQEEIRLVLRSPGIERIRCSVLGPAGTNISQACEKWIQEIGIGNKTTVEFGQTPEKCLKMACQATAPNEVAFFWTCAVYYNLYKLFFENPDTLPFFVTFVMLLDEMQLATRKELTDQVKNGQIPQGWKIASHTSPSPLVQFLVDNFSCELIKADSNSVAAEKCASGETEACITTEAARKLHNLETLHVFGSPPMVFFGGITAHGAKVIRRVHRSL